MPKQPHVTRRAAVGAVALLAGGAIAGVSATASASPIGAQQASDGVYPDDVTDTSHASREAAEFFRGYFTARTLRDPAATLKYFLPSQAGYWDAVVGAAHTPYAVLASDFTQSMPTWGKDGKSYPTLIAGDTNSAVVAFTDTAALFGYELRIIAAVDFKDGKITREVDYWDGRRNPLAAGAVPPSQYPTSLGVETVTENAAPAIDNAARALNTALAAGDAQGAANLFSTDATFQDATTRTCIEGQLAIGRYLERALPFLPYGPGTTVRHVLGSRQGGGYEWQTGSAAVPNGITLLELDDDSLITRLITVWNGSGMSDAKLGSLAALSIEN